MAEFVEKLRSKNVNMIKEILNEYLKESDSLLPLMVKVQVINYLENIVEKQVKNIFESMKIEQKVKSILSGEVN